MNEQEFKHGYDTAISDWENMSLYREFQFSPGSAAALGYYYGWWSQLEKESEELKARIINLDEILEQLR